MKTVLNTADYSLKNVVETSGSTGYPSTSSMRSPNLNSSWSHDDEVRLDSQRARSRSYRARSRSRSSKARSRSRSLDRERRRNPGERNGGHGGYTRHERIKKIPGFENKRGESSDSERYWRGSRH